MTYEVLQTTIHWKICISGMRDITVTIYDLNERCTNVNVRGHSLTTNTNHVLCVTGV